jgi:hypothetical protein
VPSTRERELVTILFQANLSPSTAQRFNLITRLSQHAHMPGFFLSSYPAQHSAHWAFRILVVRARALTPPSPIFRACLTLSRSSRELLMQCFFVFLGGQHLAHVGPPHQHLSHLCATLLGQPSSKDFLQYLIQDRITW